MSSNPRILAASVIGLILVVASFIISRSDKPVGAANSSVAIKTESVRTFVPINDTDGDGVPDWRENIPDGAAETETASSSRTETLAAELAQLMLNSNGEEGVSYSTTTVVDDTASSLISEAVDEQYTSDDITTSADNSLPALKAYGNKIAEIAIKNSVPEGSDDELTVLNRSFTSGGQEELKKLDPIIDSYSKMVEDMLTVTVPNSMTAEHLALTNVYRALLEDIKAFQNVYSDALPAMLRFRRYPEDASALYTAISNLYLKLYESGIQWNESDIASQFISIEIR